MIEMLLNVTNEYDRLIIKKYSCNIYELMIFESLNELDEDGCMMYSHMPKVSFILKPEDIKALIEKVKDVEVKP